MNRILSFDFDRKIGVLVKKKKNGLALYKTFNFTEKSETEYLEDLTGLIKKYKTVLSVEFEDYINQEISLPVIKDKKTKEFMLKNKLSNSLESNKQYKFIPIPEKNLENNVLYNVYAVPIEDVLKKINLKENLIENLEALFFSPFSLLGISNYLFPQKDIFHVYADKKSMIITVSNGKNLKYTRTVSILEGLDEQQRTNLFYENINLTYQYVIQNKSKNIDLILFSGEISENFELSKMGYDFLKKPVAVIFKESLIKNCDKETFINYLIPIGNVLIPDIYNILPDEFIEKNNFNKAVVLANFFVFVSIILFSYYEFSEYNRLQDNLSVLDRKYSLIKKEIQKFKENYKIPVEDLDFYMKYFNTLSTVEDKNIFPVFSQLKSLVSGTTIESLTIDKENGMLKIRLISKKQFQNLKDFISFKEKLKSELDIFSKNWSLKNNTKFNFEKLEVKIDISLTKNVGVS